MQAIDFKGLARSLKTHPFRDASGVQQAIRGAAKGVMIDCGIVMLRNLFTGNDEGLRGLFTRMRLAHGLQCIQMFRRRTVLISHGSGRSLGE